jgi:glycosyltransferase involved in cell wall biosynthesis
MKVCYFGPYDPGYARNRLMIKGLKKNGVNVIECNAQSHYRGLDYIRLLKKHSSLKYDAIILGARGDYFGQPIVPIIKKIAKSPVIFDAVITLYETNVLDRKLVDKRSIKSQLLYLLDYKAMQSADLVLTDTRTHATYYSRFFRIKSEKMRQVFIGSDDEVFYPREFPIKTPTFLVMFWGGFIPLQGVQYIIEAAKALEKHIDIRFELRGTGQTFESMSRLCKSLKINNLTMIPQWVSYTELPLHIARADICLGIFGGTPKAMRVIPNKAVETLAMKKPLITGDSPAARELLKDRENCMLVPMADAKALAGAILKLKCDIRLRREIADNGYKMFKEKLSPEVAGRELKSNLLELIN